MIRFTIYRITQDLYSIFLFCSLRNSNSSICKKYFFKERSINILPYIMRYLIRWKTFYANLMQIRVKLICPLNFQPRPHSRWKAKMHFDHYSIPLEVYLLIFNNLWCNLWEFVWVCNGSQHNLLRKTNCAQWRKRKRCWSQGIGM